MDSWAGFSEEDLLKVKNSTDGISQMKSRKSSDNIKKVSFGDDRLHKSRQDRHKVSSRQLSSNTTETDMHPSMKLQKTEQRQEAISTGHKIPKEMREEKPEEQQDTMELERRLSVVISEQSAEIQAENKLELLDQKVAIERDLKSLENFRVQQKAIEEANNQKKALLAKTLSERKQKAKKEAYKLEHIQKELSKLDSLLTADVQVIRNKIEEASRDFMDAQRRFEKAEIEYIAAKVDVHNKSELKEQLTDHLYTIIQQNEVRKAKKLADLMKELDMEDSAEDLCLPELPPLSCFQPSTVVVSPTGSTPFLIKSSSNDSHDNVDQIISKPSEVVYQDTVGVINPEVNTPCIKNSTADTQANDSHALVSDKNSSDQTAIDIDMSGEISGNMKRGVDMDMNTPAEHEKT